MAKLLKLRRGTTTQHGSFTGAEGEVTVDTDKETLVVHDGSTAGGHPVAAEDMANVSSASIAGRLANDSIATSKLAAGALPSDVTVASANIVNGTIVDADIASNAAIAGTKLENSGVTAGTYGSSSAIPIVTVDAQGLVTGASTTAIDSTTISNGSSSVAVANNGAITSNANHDFSAGIDVTGNITCSGTVDGVDVATRDSLFGGLTSVSGVLTNGVQATTQGTSDNSTKVATTAYVTTAIGNIQAFVSGMILIWSGAANAVPSGWVLCNGSNSTPDLRDRFIIGAGNSYSVNATGGSSTISTNISHSHSTPNHLHGMNGHTHSTPNHSHSVNNHTHSISGSVSGNTNNTGGHSHNCSAWRYGSTQSDGTRFQRDNNGYNNYNLTTESSGNHNHSFSGSFSGNSGNSAPNTNNSGASNTGGANGNTTSSGASNTGSSGSGNSTSVLNPYYALCYIMKT